MMKPTGDPIVIIGGGFYGCSIAEFLAKHGAKVILIEREPQLLGRASYHNQARLHGGYHYPRSFGTAYRSRLNFSQFMHDYQPAVVSDFVKLYAIACRNSKVTAKQFETFCTNIGAKVREAKADFWNLFSPQLIEAVYETQEYAFNAAILRGLLMQRMQQLGVEVFLETSVVAVRPARNEKLVVQLGTGLELTASYVFNCTYSGLNTIAGIPPTQMKLKHEVTELALVKLPSELNNLSVTVMDGPFFSFMPFPDRGLSTFSHVRYTPHAMWLEANEPCHNPYKRLDEFPKDTAFGFFIRDAMRYMPCLIDTIYCDSLFEIKTVLVKNEGDDGRPILFDWNPETPRIVSILGSKIDNIYDALVAVESHLNDY